MAEADPKVDTAAVASLTPAFAVRLSSALRVRPFISREETRYYLNGMRVEECPKGGAFCVATDGHRLGVQRDPDGLCLRPVIVRLPAEIKMPTVGEMKMMRRSPWLVCVESDGKGYVSVVPPLPGEDIDTAEAAIERVEDASIRIGKAVIDGVYPDWKRVIPTPPQNAISRSFNPRYIKDFGDNMMITGASENEPHLVRTNDRDFVGVLMPMRMIAAPRPDWLPEVPAADAA